MKHKNLKTRFSSPVDDNLAHVTRCRRNSVLNLSGYVAIERRHTPHDSGRISVNLHNKIVRRPVRSVYSVAILYYIFIEETTTYDESRIVAGYIIFRERVGHGDGTTAVQLEPNFISEQSSKQFVRYKHMHQQFTSQVFIYRLRYY